MNYRHRKGHIKAVDGGGRRPFMEAFYESYVQPVDFYSLMMIVN